MAYTKLPKVVSDYSLGYQSANILRANFEAQHDAFVVEHGETEPQYDPLTHDPIYPAASSLIGHHNTPLIPRDVVRVAVASAGLTQAILGISGSNFVVGAQRFSAGQYFFEVGSLSQFWAQCVANVSSSSTMTWVSPRTVYATAYGQKPGIAVTAYRLVGSAWTPTDCHFTLTLYGA